MFQTTGLLEWYFHGASGTRNINLYGYFFNIVYNTRTGGKYNIPLVELCVHHGSKCPRFCYTYDAHTTRLAYYECYILRPYVIINKNNNVRTTVRYINMVYEDTRTHCNSSATVALNFEKTRPPPNPTLAHTLYGPAHASRIVRPRVPEQFSFGCKVNYFAICIRHVYSQRYRCRRRRSKDV